MQADECRAAYEMVERVARSFGVRDLELMVGGSVEALTRFANNEIHQNVVERGRMLSLRVQLDHKTARASTNRLDEESVRRMVEEAVALTQSVEPDPDMLPLYTPEDVVAVD